MTQAQFDALFDRCVNDSDAALKNKDESLVLVKELASMSLPFIKFASSVAIISIMKGNEPTDLIGSGFLLGVAFGKYLAVEEAMQKVGKNG